MLYERKRWSDALESWADTLKLLPIELDKINNIYGMPQVYDNAFYQAQTQVRVAANYDHRMREIIEQLRIKGL